MQRKDWINRQSIAGWWLSLSSDAVHFPKVRKSIGILAISKHDLWLIRILLNTIDSDLDGHTQQSVTHLQQQRIVMDNENRGREKGIP
jgi:hypothetical protein